MVRKSFPNSELVIISSFPRRSVGTRDESLKTARFQVENPPPLQAVGFQETSSGEDRTPFELFIAGVRGWEADLRRRLDEGKSKPG